MILQALVSYYEDLLKTGKTAKPGWEKAKISFGLNLDDEEGDRPGTTKSYPQYREKRSGSTEIGRGAQIGKACFRNQSQFFV